MAGCIPVYLGAPNISDYIPSGCYIDFGVFSSYDELHNYLVGVSEDEFNSRQREIERFLNSKESNQFEANRFPDLILQCLEDSL